jgi:hypothetical protein
LDIRKDSRSLTETSEDDDGSGHDIYKEGGSKKKHKKKKKDKKDKKLKEAKKSEEKKRELEP